MTTNYDPITEQYQRSKQQPWRTFIECFTLMELMGDPRGMAVLDVACGEGFYTRMIRQRGAARVTGIDLSSGMIDLARRQESQHRLGIDYIVGDARKLSGAEPYDLAVDGLAEKNQEYWSSLLDYPPISFIECVK